MAELRKGQGLRQSMAWLHTWSGLLVCWVLFLVFCGGTASYVKDEITLWMKPELHARLGGDTSAAATRQAADGAIAFLRQQAPNAERWFINLPDDRRPTTSVFWLRQPRPEDAGKGNRARLETRTLDAVTGNPVPGARETRGGEFLYRLHFDLHYMSAIWARWIIGFCTMFMLVAILSGVITHRRIFADFFTFRARKGQRSWLDAHNATAVLALPFHLMITYTGLVTLLFMYMPWGMQAVYKGDTKRFDAELGLRAPRVQASGVQAPLAPVGPMLAQATARWDGVAPARITVERPNDANAIVTMTRDAGRSLSSVQPTVVFAGTTGALKETFGEDPANASATRGVMVGLHVAHFAPPLLRALFFASGLAGCLMVATGALLWAVRTRKSHAHTIAATGRTPFGLRLVEALNLGVIAGLPIAFASYFWANRLVPVGIAQRPDMEIRMFFAAWAVAALVAQIRPTRGMWRVQLGIGAVLFAGLPLLNALTGTAHLGVTLLHGPAVLAGFDLTVLAMGLGLGAAAWLLGRPRPVARGVGATARAGAMGEAS